MYLPIIGAFLEATGMIIEKNVLRSRKLTYKNYTVFVFLGIVLITLPFLYWIWRIDAAFWNIYNVFLFSIVIITALVANLLTFYSLKRENIGEFEPLWLMQPLFTIVLAIMIYPSERNWVVVFLALVASVSLVLMHVKKSHLEFDRYLVAGVLASFFFAVELVASKDILPYFSSFTFYFVRCFFIFAFAFIMYRPSFRPLNNKMGRNIVVIGITWILYRAILYAGYESLGIVYTTILFILSPVLMLFFAAIFLKERLTRRQIITNCIIIACVALTVVAQKLY